MAAADKRLPPLRSIEIETVAEGVYAAIAVPGEGALGNAGIVDLGGRTLVFDTLRTPEAAGELRFAAEHLTGGPVAWVGISHWHDHHCAGNQVFAPRASIVGTACTRELMATRLVAEYEQDVQDMPGFIQAQEEQLRAETDGGKRQNLAIRLGENRRYAAAIPAIRVTPPDVTFERRVVFHGAARAAELVTYGGGHTESDAFLYLRAERVGFMGDLAFLEYHPWLHDGDPREWVRILQEIERMAPRTVVPGHGPVTDTRALALTREYITMLQRMVGEVVSGGGTLEQALALRVPPPYDTWGVAQFLGPNVRFLYERMR